MLQLLPSTGRPQLDTRLGGSMPGFRNGVAWSNNLIEWTSIDVSQPLVAGKGYISTTGGAMSFSLPATAVVGSIIGIILAGATSWTITQGASQSITVSPVTTTIGVGGSVSSNSPGSSLALVCTVANTSWVANSSIGTFTIV